MPSTLTEALLDVNVVIAAVFEDHVAHVRARQAVEGLTRFITTPTTQGGFLRFATRPWKDAQKNEQPPRLSMVAAMETLRQLTAAPAHKFLPDSVPFTDVGLRSLQGHRQWTDAYLLRCARHHGLRLFSLDGRMANMDDSADPVLSVIPP
jgi:hypothetical protein